MAFNEIEAQRIKRVVEAYGQKKRPPPHIRPKLDIGFRIDRQSVEIFEMRPAWRRPEEILEHSVAKATFVRTRGVWKVFWLRADLKWHNGEDAQKVLWTDCWTRTKPQGQAKKEPDKLWRRFHKGS